MDTTTSSNVPDEIHEAAERHPSEIMIKFIDRPGSADDDA